MVTTSTNIPFILFTLNQICVSVFQEIQSLRSYGLPCSPNIKEIINMGLAQIFAFEPAPFSTYFFNISILMIAVIIDIKSTTSAMMPPMEKTKIS